jgi:hypothetical protein
MQVRELVKILKECDQDLNVFLFNEDESELYELDTIDDSLTDRVDINFQPRSV